MVITEDTKKVCEILGIDPNTSDDEVDKAYSAMMAQWHTSSDNLTKEKLVELTNVYNRVAFHRDHRIKNDQSAVQSDSIHTKKDPLVDSDTFGSEKGSLTEESKSFPTSKGSIIRSAFIPFLLTLPFIIAIVAQIMNSQEMNSSLLIPVFILVIIWLPFLRRPYEIVLVHKQLAFKSPIRTVKVNVGDLISVRVGVLYWSFFFKSKKKSIEVMNISEWDKQWDELIKIIKSMNPAVEIKRYSKAGRMIGIWIYPVIVTSLICFLGLFVHSLRINITECETDLAPVIVALEKYKTANNHYPDKLEALTPIYLDALPRTGYYFDADSDEYTLGRYVFMFSKHLYSSRTKKWRNED
jgi:hypothetical protein